jgi:hypothetical protein
MQNALMMGECGYQFLRAVDKGPKLCLTQNASLLRVRV